MPFVRHVVAGVEFVAVFDYCIDRCYLGVGNYLGEKVTGIDNPDCDIGFENVDEIVVDLAVALDDIAVIVVVFGVHNKDVGDVGNYCMVFDCIGRVVAVLGGCGYLRGKNCQGNDLQLFCYCWHIDYLKKILV